MSESKSQYIAETNEAGLIEAVWVTDATGRSVHPVKSPARHLDLVGDAACSGASSKAIHQWLHAKSLRADHAG